MELTREMIEQADIDGLVRLQHQALQECGVADAEYRQTQDELLALHQAFVEVEGRQRRAAERLEHIQYTLRRRAREAYEQRHR